MSQANFEYKGAFETLEVWKEARAFRNKIWELVKLFPVDEKYQLISQIVRSSRSIGNNISEGYGRYHFKDNIKFCRNARGSLMETLDHLFIAVDLKYIDQQTFNEFKDTYDKLLKLINGYIHYLKTKDGQ